MSVDEILYEATNGGRESYLLQGSVRLSLERCGVGFALSLIISHGGFCSFEWMTIVVLGTERRAATTPTGMIIF